MLRVGHPEEGEWFQSDVGPLPASEYQTRNRGCHPVAIIRETSAIWIPVNHEDINKLMPIHAKFRQGGRDKWVEGTLADYYARAPYKYKDSFGQWWKYCLIDKIAERNEGK